MHLFPWFSRKALVFKFWDVFFNCFDLDFFSSTVSVFPSRTPPCILTGASWSGSLLVFAALSLSTPLLNCFLKMSCLWL